jgi:hypothetical protein
LHSLIYPLIYRQRDTRFAYIIGKIFSSSSSERKTGLWLPVLHCNSGHALSHRKSLFQAYAKMRKAAKKTHTGMAICRRLAAPLYGRAASPRCIGRTRVFEK